MAFPQVFHCSSDDARLNWDSSRFKQALDTGVFAASRHRPRRHMEANMDNDEEDCSKELELQRHLLLAKKRNLEAVLRRQVNPRESGRLESPTRAGGAGSSPHGDTSPKARTGPTDQAGEEMLRLKLAIKDKIEQLKQQQANQSSNRREFPAQMVDSGRRSTVPLQAHGGNSPVRVRTPKEPGVIERCSSAPGVNSNSCFVGTSRFGQTSGAGMSQVRCLTPHSSLIVHPPP